MSSRGPLIARHRAIGPVVGGIVLIAITVGLAVVVGGFTAVSVESSLPSAAFELEVDADRAELRFDHVAGDPVDVDDLSIGVWIDGEPLDRQPTVPFVGTEGFHGTPAGPFNAKSDSTWRTGERATIRIAATNEPTIDRGDVVTVEMVIDDTRTTRLEATAT